MDINKILENNFKEYVSEQIDELMNEQIDKFAITLKRKKDDYIAHIMKNIRILSEYNHITKCMKYEIRFINEDIK